METTQTNIRPLHENELTPALLLVWRVFTEFEAPDYTPEGIETFRAFILPETIRNRFSQGAMQAWGAFRQGVLIGVLATREQTHISLLFVEKSCHRQGVARALFSHLCECLAPRLVQITVNSSPYAIEAYRRLGFTPTSPECTTDGIRYTPMTYTL